LLPDSAAGLNNSDRVLKCAVSTEMFKQSDA